MLNKSAKLFFILCSVCLAVANTSANEQNKPEVPPTPQDFAYAVPLLFEGQDALYQATLPLGVYQGIVRGDLGDLRVFNAQGEVVPHMLRQPERSNTSQPVLGKLAYFPLRGAANAGLDQLAVRIRRNTAGTLVDISSNAKTVDIGSQAKPGAQAKLCGYLLDASALKQSIQALELDWKNSKDSFVGTLTIESSDDLKHWNSVARNAPLASLQFGGHRLLQQRVEFPALQAKYLRLSWPPQQQELQLGSINAELAGSRVDAALSWHKISGGAVAGKDGEFEFDIGAQLPLQRVRIELPQMNTLVQAALFSRAHTKDNWLQVNSTVLYKLHHSGQDLNNPDITVSGNHRYWLLRVEQKNGGIGSGVPQMQVGWQPHQLQFVTRGSAPFQLAYGSSQIKPGEFQMQNVLPKAGQDQAELKIQSAQTGAQITLGGAARLSPPAPSLPWKKWILWAVLGVSVLLLGWMAYRLVKQMEHHDSIKL